MTIAKKRYIEAHIDSEDMQLLEAAENVSSIMKIVLNVAHVWINALMGYIRMVQKTNSVLSGGLYSWLPWLSEIMSCGFNKILFFISTQVWRHKFPIPYKARSLCFASMDVVLIN